MYLEKGLEKWSDEYDIVLGGGYTSCRGGGLDVGPVTYADIQTRFPFDNDIYLCSIPGSTLKSRFINTTNSDYYIALSPYGESIKNSINTSKTYYVIADTYNIDYASNKLTKIEKLADYGYYGDPGCFARDVIAEYIAEGNYGSESSDTTNIKGTLENPYTVEDALAIAVSDRQYGFIKGTVSNTSKMNLSSSNKNLYQLYIKDDKGNEIYVYCLSRINGASTSNNFTSVNDIKVGDELVIYGSIYFYNGTPQIGTGSYCVSINGVNTK